MDDREVRRMWDENAEAWTRLARAGHDVYRDRVTLGEWLNALLDIGFQIDRIAEPDADENTATDCPTVADTRFVAYFLIVRCQNAA